MFYHQLIMPLLNVLRGILIALVILHGVVQVNNTAWIQPPRIASLLEERLLLPPQLLNQQPLLQVRTVQVLLVPAVQ